MLDKKEDKSIIIPGCVYCAAGELMDFSGAKHIELDMGCGKGSFTTVLAQRLPESKIIAADVMIGRLRALVRRNQRENVSNVIPLRMEARMLMGMTLPDNFLHRLHILCPDPWPKGKHRANRLLCSDFVVHLHRVLEPGGMFHFSTDDLPYLETVKKVVSISGLFDEFQEGYEEIADIKSDFELRWNGKGMAVTHLVWKKRNIVKPDNYKGH